MVNFRVQIGGRAFIRSWAFIRDFTLYKCHGPEAAYFVFFLIGKIVEKRNLKLPHPLHLIPNYVTRPSFNQEIKHFLQEPNNFLQ